MRGNADNLTPFDKRPEDEQRKIRQAGGRASGAARRKKRELKEVLKVLLAEEITDKNSGKTATRREAMALGLLNQAIRGNVKAVKLVAELTNEMPPQSVDVAVTNVKKPAIVFRDADEMDEKEAENDG